MPSLFKPLGAAARSILMVGTHQSYSTGAGLNEGFRALGWDVGEVSVHDALIESDLPALRLVSRLTRRLAIKSYNASILKAAERLRPDVMLTVKGTYIERSTIEALKAMGILTVNFWPDCEFEHEGSDEDTIALYDQIFTTKSFQMPYLLERVGHDRAHFIHHGYVPRLHRKRVNDGQTPHYLWDVSYIGNASPAKFQWLKKIALDFPDLSLLVIGYNWREFAKGTPLAASVFGSGLVGDHFARVVEHSRINLSVHYGTVGKRGWADLVSTRTFEIPACGGFMLHIDNPEVRSLFDVPTEIDVFSSPDQLNEKIKYYLAHEDEREAMARKAYDRAVPDYSLINRAREIALVLDSHLSP